MADHPADHPRHVARARPDPSALHASDAEFDTRLATELRHDKAILVDVDPVDISKISATETYVDGILSFRAA